MYVCSRIHFGRKLNPSETGPRKNPGSLSEELGVQGGGLTGSGPKTRREPEYPMESLEAHRTEVGIELPTLEVGGKHCVPPSPTRLILASADSLPSDFCKSTV